MENGAQVGGKKLSESKRRRKSAAKYVGQMNLWESENEFMRPERLLRWSDSYVVNCSLSPRQSVSRAQCDAITHRPNAYVSLGTAVKAPCAWKYGITDNLLQALVAQPFPPHKQWITDTWHSPPFFKCFSVSVSDSQFATVAVQPAAQPDVSSSSMLLLCCSFPLTARKIIRKGESRFVFSGDWDLVFCVRDSREAF